MERGKIKCARYWPDLNSEETYGDFLVETVAEDVNKDYTLREFLVKNVATEKEDIENGKVDKVEERRVYHYHFQVNYYLLHASINSLLPNMLKNQNVLVLARSWSTFRSRLCLELPS